MRYLLRMKKNFISAETLRATIRTLKPKVVNNFKWYADDVSSIAMLFINIAILSTERCSDLALQHPNLNRAMVQPFVVKLMRSLTTYKTSLGDEYVYTSHHIGLDGLKEQLQSLVDDFGSAHSREVLQNELAFAERDVDHIIRTVNATVHQLLHQDSYDTFMDIIINNLIQLNRVKFVHHNNVNFVPLINSYATVEDIEKKRALGARSY